MRAQVVITLFNMRLRASMVGPDPPIHSGNYLEGRFELFEKFCYPSVKNQTVRDFTWLVAMSDGTPAAFRERMAGLAATMPTMRTVYLDDEAASRFLAELGSYLELGDEVVRVISTRVCNDDAVAVDYLERVRAICDARPDEEYFISFPRGLRYSVSHGFSVADDEVTNQFLSLHTIRRARGDPLDHMHLYDHTKVERTGRPIVVDRGEVMWLECNHDTNLTNRLYMSDYARPVFGTGVYRRFALDPAEYGILRRGKLLVMLAFAAGAWAARAKNGLRAGLRKVRSRA